MIRAANTGDVRTVITRLQAEQVAEAEATFHRLLPALQAACLSHRPVARLTCSQLAL